MKDYSFDLSALSVTETEAFGEATLEELRVLLVLIERGGSVSSDELASLARTSRQRAASAVVFWESAGVLASGDKPRVTLEFAPRAERTEIYDRPRKDTALTIRNRGLRDLIDEFAKMLKKPNLSDGEVHKITTLSLDYALSEEFLYALAHYLHSKNRFSITRLFNEATDLVREKIDTPSLLDEHLKSKESEEGYMRELRRTLGINRRALSASEKELFTRWSVEFGYSTEIIGEAYDIAVMNTGERSLQYMDTILTRWHDGGCRTVAQCRALSEKERAANAEKKRAASAKESTAKKKNDEAKFLSFDPNEALRRALERSYKEISEDDDK